ncbi:MarR family protein [Nonomuraea maritima]|uniref:MarR family protein n=1 Tax=Nonomuraea maritima TaxID=683260 RepID=A0A1G9KQG4_9ACTN|nr:MarR family transcriptional regulator [Nonomuraea maritima]SDL51697.1 MarR family protein [Nonomuraea maritima]
MRDGPDLTKVLDWVERVAAFASGEWGLTPVTGRVLAWLMACAPPEQSAAEIAGAVGASRASLTTSLRLLTSARIVGRVHRPGDRTVYYRLEDDAWSTIIERQLTAFTVFDRLAAEGLRLGWADDEQAARIRSARDSIAALHRRLDPPAQPVDNQ